MDNFRSLFRLALGFIALGCISGRAQTYVYTYTGDDFTSASAPYATSDKVTGSLTFSAPLGANFGGNAPATLLSFSFNDGVGPQITGGPAVPAQDSIVLGTDSSGAIVSWNINLLVFLPPAQTETKRIWTENDSGGVFDRGILDVVSGVVGAGAVRSPGTWVLTATPEPSTGVLFVAFAALVLAYRRFKASLSRPR